jgi:hypothetical protein
MVWAGYNDKQPRGRGQPPSRGGLKDIERGWSGSYSVTKGLRCLHTTFGGFGLFNLPVEQLICRVNMQMQHYHTSTNLSRKLDASLQYLQLQLGMSHNPLLLDYDTWGHLAPLSWVKMLWWTLNHFDIHLHITYPTIALPQERDQVITEIFLSAGLGPDLIRSLGRCRVAHEALFLSDLTTADGKYLGDFVFAPGRKERASTFKFPRSDHLGATRNHGSTFGTTLPRQGTSSRFH